MQFESKINCLHNTFFKGTPRFPVKGKYNYGTNDWDLEQQTFFFFGRSTCIKWTRKYRRVFFVDCQSLLFSALYTYEHSCRHCWGEEHSNTRYRERCCFIYYTNQHSQYVSNDVATFMHCHANCHGIPLYVTMNSPRDWEAEMGRKWCLWWCWWWLWLVCGHWMLVGTIHLVWTCIELVSHWIDVSIWFSVSNKDVI